MKHVNAVCRVWSNEVWDIKAEIYLVIDYNISFKIAMDNQIYDPIQIEIVSISTEIGYINIKSMRNRFIFELVNYLEAKRAMREIDHYMNTKDIP